MSESLRPPRLFCPGNSPGKTCPPPGDFPNPEIKPRSPTLQADSLQAEPPGNLGQSINHGFQSLDALEAHTTVTSLLSKER